MRPNISHYCQKCLAANPLGQEFCARCGTRLMIVVESAAARFEAGPTSLSTDEHLLERISAAETRVARLAERLERSLGLLTEDGVVESERLERMWSERCQQDTIEQEENVHRDELRMRILAAARMA